MEVSNIIIEIKEQAFKTQKYFVYNKKRYPVNYNMLKSNCAYFINNGKIFEEVEDIDLLNEEEEKSGITLTEESINSFIKICQNESCPINLTLVIPLQYLSYKYEFPELKRITDGLVAQYSKELLFEKLSFSKKKGNCYIDTSNEEEFLSKHIKEYINKEEMVNLSIPVLERVLQHCFNKKNQEKDNEIDQNDLIDFLFKCLDHHGRKASVLFNNIDFSEENINVIYRLFHHYKDVFDFSFINSTLANTVLKLTNALVQQKEEYTKNITQMKDWFEEKQKKLQEVVDEIKIKEEEDKRKEDERKRKYESETIKIKKDCEQKMTEIENKNHQIMEKIKDMCYNVGATQRYRKIVSTFDMHTFNKFDIDGKRHIIDEIINNCININELEEKPLNQTLINTFLWFKKLFLVLTKNDSVKCIKSLNKFITDNSEHFSINNDICEHLYQENRLVEILHDILDNFDDLSIEIEYPTKSFDQISNIICDVYKQYYSNKMKLALIIKENDCLNHKSDIYGIINSVDVQVTNLAFEDQFFFEIQKFE